MSEETMKILDMLKEGKITAEEAHRLLGDLEQQGDSVEIAGGTARIIKSVKDKPKGFGSWINKLLFAFIPMILGLGLVGFFIYGVFYYLPVHAPQAMLLVFGLIAVIILCITLICIAGIGIARKALSKKILIQDKKDDEKIEISDEPKK
ncbi:MAG: hypothetical protein V1709_02765 [Planctomycetota bacterium]